VVMTASDGCDQLLRCCTVVGAVGMQMINHTVTRPFHREDGAHASYACCMTHLARAYRAIA
jgi:hypothetical protein